MKSPIERRHQKDKRQIPLRGEGTQKINPLHDEVEKVISDSIDNNMPGKF